LPAVRMRSERRLPKQHVWKLARSIRFDAFDLAVEDTPLSEANRALASEVAHERLGSVIHELRHTWIEETRHSPILRGMAQQKSKHGSARSRLYRPD
jgi:hypothetical protein